MTRKKSRGAVPIHPGEILLEEFLRAYTPPVSRVEAADRSRRPARSW
jgi:plasmid maintenance system antidote protein VapI